MSKNEFNADGKNRFPVTMAAICLCSHDANHHGIIKHEECSQCDCKQYRPDPEHPQNKELGVGTGYAE